MTWPSDRGTIKWTSLMMPEHVEMVQEVFKEQTKEEKPVLDEQQIQDHAFTLEMAIKDNLTVEIKYHNGHNYSYFTVKVVGINTDTKKVSCFDQQKKEEIQLNFYDIFEVTVL
ncbi:YolD-like family protein [Halobacillus sp. A5]|uniref:YolD-like family protein n=1 Tax=Halobacillus sp. A5 TaxID=2880263 RepID=UPI0020A63AA9|nr:YolD-like family protein [Halobacillus sp. A5]MCP3025985.1 YolD-like family protein [Halobacillus sp. A5]